MNTTPVASLGTPFEQVNAALAGACHRKIDGNMMREAGVVPKGGSRPGNVRVHKFAYPGGLMQCRLKDGRDHVPWYRLTEAVPVAAPVAVSD